MEVRSNAATAGPPRLVCAWSVFQLWGLPGTPELRDSPCL